VKLRDILESNTIEIALRKKYPEVRFVAKEDSSKFVLSIFVIQAKRRNKGEARNFLEYLIELAKKYNKDIYLSATDIYGADLNKLNKFYKSLGFVKNMNPKVKETLIRVNK